MHGPRSAPSSDRRLFAGARGPLDARAAARRLQYARRMSTIERRVIVAAVDDTNLSSYVVQNACDLATRTPGAELHLLHVFEWMPRSGVPAEASFSPSTSEMLEKGRKLLEDASKAALEKFPGKVTGHLAAGTAWREIVQTATNLDADLIVVGSRKLGAVQRFLLGSVASEVVAKAQCPVFVARPKDYNTQTVPEIEPACPDCLETQKKTQGAELWCEAHHRKHRPAGHTYSEIPPSFGVGSMFFRP